MPDDAPAAEPETPFPDLRTIRRLVRLMARYDLTALDLGEGPRKIRLRRHGWNSAPSAPPHPPTLPHAPTTVPHAPASPPHAPPAEPPPSAKGVFIESPMVGTFYAASSPDAPPFVAVGSVVRPDTTVCVIEAMKVFTDIPAGVAGTIVEVLVKNGQPVEFGQKLFRVEPTG